ncbi:MAG: NAD(P)-dependent oxidoreductase [Alphaproteobacteria bacterium]|nr:NAD(P)-dependent oxidoreductase [Alphaproteobacteria bacterium]MCB1739195.1 NAD(P)-dependent oxidoreductase [Gammaproteobacteria bacterium]
MKVGFIGLGTMGGGMASNLQKAGHELVVHDLARQLADRHIAAGAVWVDSPKAVAEAADVVMTSLPGPPEMEAVTLDPNSGLIAGIREGSVYFDLSTNSPALVREVHARFAERGAQVFDAPVSGGPKGANSGRLAIWVGGDEASFEAHRQVLDAIGDQVRYIGPIGSGSIAKLVHNSAGYAIQCAIGEVFCAGVKAGVEPLALWEAIRQGARGRLRTFDSLKDHFLINSYDPPDFALKLALKDITLAGQMARDVGVPMRLVNMAQAEMTEAVARGWGHRDSRAFMLLQQERAGIKVEVAAEEIEKVLEAERQAGKK